MHTGRPGWVGLWLGACLLTGAVNAHEAAAQEPSNAARLFDQGLVDMRAGRHEAACPALAESYRLEPLAGVLFTLAECEASWGRLSTAVDHYEEFLKVLVTLPNEQSAKHKERRQVALEKISALSRLVPHLAIAVPSDAPPGLVIRRNGDTVPPSSWGVSVGLDPGDYEIVAEAPDGRVWSRKVTLSKGENARADVVLAWLKRERAIGSSNEDRAGTAGGPANPYRTWAWVTAGIGAASLGVGAATGAVVLGKKGTIEDECVDRVCTQAGKDAADSAQTWGMVSTVGFGVGVAFGAASALLFLQKGDAPTEPKVTATPSAAWRPWVAPEARGAAIGVEGRF